MSLHPWACITWPLWPLHSIKEPSKIAFKFPVATTLEDCAYGVSRMVSTAAVLAWVQCLTVGIPVVKQLEAVLDFNLQGNTGLAQ